MIPQVPMLCPTFKCRLSVNARTCEQTSWRSSRRAHLTPKNIVATNVKEKKDIVLAHGMDKADEEKMNEDIGDDYKRAKQTNGDEETHTQCNADL